MELTPRAEILLKALIERYILDGEPIGSRTLSRQPGLDWSPATIRNVMADLEELGLIHAPHTSAGRVPTVLGYRLFVNSLLTVSPMSNDDVRRLQSGLRSEHEPERILESASRLLSEVTRLAGVVTLPAEEEIALRQVEFLKLSPGRVLFILVTSDGRVLNRVIESRRACSDAELTAAANYFNATYSGKTLAAVRRELVAAMEADSDAIAGEVRAALDLARRALAERGDAGTGVFLSGESNLLNLPDLGDLESMRRLFAAFSAKRDLLFLLDAGMRSSGVQIFIGEESGYQAFESCAVVTAPYQVNGRVVGTLGVIGPTRMHYEQVIPIVDVTSRILGNALGGLESGAA
jgi:heat-inducible transcriptional repressor